MAPEQLLSGRLTDMLGAWQDKTVTIDRISALLDRGSALALTMEKWLRAGLWVMTRSDPDYPKRLKHYLRGDSPAVFFGCGNKILLNGGGLAVVGSRNVKEADLDYTRKVGALAASAGVSIVSGGARGVDETAMLGALEAEGTAVGILSDSLLRVCSSAKYRRYLLDNNLVLISPFNPEAGFKVGNAMQRNKYIYCLSDAALAVHSGKTGGTWNGAQEDLRYRWVPLWVKRTDDPEAGNLELIAAGGREAPSNIDEVEISNFFEEKADQSTADQPLSSSNGPSAKKPPAVPRPEAGADPGTETQAEWRQNQTAAEIEQQAPQHEVDASVPEALDLSSVTFYELFLVKTKEICGTRPRTTDDLVEALAVNKTQLNDWLKQAVEDGELTKLVKPVRYEVSLKQATLALESCDR
ncbi:DNA-processing protein DprA [Thiorhodococcus mannitoliphagus]|uniref:DNA-processing protein DprA n=1 Tax=Thiorhodococcus mannitoliphagus TaxID=329406 RepID=UPI00197FED10|nr:DNA-processing protein DprA [Thiorhodococcus mannitoliphagus]